MYTAARSCLKIYDTDENPELEDYIPGSILLRDLSFSNDPTLPPIPMTPRRKDSSLAHSLITLSPAPHSPAI